MLLQSRDDIQHVRFVLSESQKVLATVVMVMNALQEEVHTLGVIFTRQQQQRIEIQPASTASGSGAPSRKHKDKGDKRKMSESLDTSVSLA